MINRDPVTCDQEPIHVPGAILPHGAMLVLDCDTFKIIQAAGDTEALIGQPIGTLLGRGMDTLLRPDQIQRIHEMAIEPGSGRPQYLLDPVLRIRSDRPVDVSLHRSGKSLVVEYENASSADRHATDPLSTVQAMLEGYNDTASVAEFCQIVTERVRRITGYDRVMVYRFLEDESGSVIAESRPEHLAPFLGLHYPASDIPKQARALYLLNRVRAVPMVEYEPAPLIPANNPLTGHPLDMSFATLRDVSPIHRQYLRNMGVAASMSISIVQNGRLWGLIACHHYSPYRLPSDLRVVCEMFGSLLSLQLDAAARREQFDARSRSRDVLRHMILQMATEDDYAPGIARRSMELLDYIDAGGLSLFEGESNDPALGTGIESFGGTPSEEQLAALATWLFQKMKGGDGIFMTDRLAELWPPAKAFSETGSGLLAISLSEKPRRAILWFRPEIIHAITWAGDPAKPVEAAPFGARLMPRASFEAWQQTVRGRSLPWTSSDRDSAFDLRVALLEIVLRRIDALARERQRVHEHERLLIAELDHRVKNTLGVIQSLVVQTSRSATSLTEFVIGLDSRIRSMAKSHSLLTQSHWSGIAIHTLLHEELDQYGLGSAAIVLSGPDLVLTPKAALALSLAIHELATNAAKYGALSTPSGRAAMRWIQAKDGSVELTWIEAGGPLVSTPQHRGFGSKLIEQALAMETGGRSVIRFLPAGVQCDIVLPAISVAGVDAVSASETTNDTPDTPRPVENGRPRILIVEDSSLIVMLLEEILEEQGWELVGPATRVAAALDLARRERIDAALLDINLDGEMSWDVASALKKRNVPFAFSTGYGSAAAVPAHLADIAVIKKPFRITEVESRLREMLGARAGHPA